MTFITAVLAIFFAALLHIPVLSAVVSDQYNRTRDLGVIGATRSVAGGETPSVEGFPGETANSCCCRLERFLSTKAFGSRGWCSEGAFVVVVVVQGFSPRLSLAILLVHVYAYIQQQNGEEDRTKRMLLPNLLARVLQLSCKVNHDP